MWRRGLIPFSPPFNLKKKFLLLIPSLAALALISTNIQQRQPNRTIIVPPHLQWLYGKNYKPGQFGYGKRAGPRSITVTGMTQNAGSDKKQQSSGS